MCEFFGTSRGEFFLMEDALRISQLDASTLDEELLAMFRNQIRKACSLFPGSFFLRIGPEANAILRWIIWKFSFSSGNATPGQQMLNVRYVSSDSSAVSVWQKWAYGLVFILGRYIDERSTDLKSALNFRPLWGTIDIVENLWNVLNTVNVLVFLQRGKYQSLLERIIGLKMVLSQKQSVRQVGYEFLNRELLWHGFAEFLFFLLPFINTRHLKNLVQRNVSFLHLRSNPEVDCTKCGICEESPPTTPHKATSCGHVFCYYCITANRVADPEFKCPQCGSLVQEITQA
ncbi:peroxisome biogenesis factor 2-like [Oscarella lobularis]|uniref:peroxisome biogenesis factor 2-like n=1 Tax=Oscarella lobularis TaxID=121494 RepID=UPI00331376DD